MKKIVFLLFVINIAFHAGAQTTKVDVSVEKKESLSDIILKGSQSSNNYAEAYRNRVQAQESEIRLFRERQKLREEYESKAIKVPEMDFNNGQQVKLKASTVQTVKIEAFLPSYWSYNTENLDRFVFVETSRTLEDGSILSAVVFLADKNYFGKEPLIFLNEVKELFKSQPTVSQGFYRETEGEKRSIRFVPPGSNANLAGLKKGDLILEIDGKEITDEQISSPDFSITTLISEKSPGDTIQLVGKRDGKLFLANLELEKPKGIFTSEFQVRNNPTIMFSQTQLINSYGEDEEILTVYNYTPYKNLMIVTVFTIQSNNGNTNWDFQFQRFRKSMSRFVENLVIN